MKKSATKNVNFDGFFTLWPIFWASRWMSSYNIPLNSWSLKCAQYFELYMITTRHQIWAHALGYVKNSKVVNFDRSHCKCNFIDVWLYRTSTIMLFISSALMGIQRTIFQLRKYVKSSVFHPVLAFKSKTPYMKTWVFQRALISLKIGVYPCFGPLATNMKSNFQNYLVFDMIPKRVRSFLCVDVF